MTNLSWEQLCEAMKSCEQTKGQSVYEHCHSVWNWYAILNEILAYGYHSEKCSTLIGRDNFKLPSWFLDYEDDLAMERHCSNIAMWYAEYHDCGKPFLKTTDDGGNHFSGHAKKSYDVWTELIIKRPVDLLSDSVYAMRDKTKGEVVGLLILHDMDIHTMKAKDIDPLLEKLGSRTVTTLLLMALCEIHSNANMFGGIDSPSFKMKWKQIDRRGKAICKKIFGDKK